MFKGRPPQISINLRIRTVYGSDVAKQRFSHVSPYNLLHCRTWSWYSINDSVFHQIVIIKFAQRLNPSSCGYWFLFVSNHIRVAVRVFILTLNMYSWSCVPQNSLQTRNMFRINYGVIYFVLKNGLSQAKIIDIKGKTILHFTIF